jgi:hypothetical protein
MPPVSSSEAVTPRRAHEFNQASTMLMKLQKDQQRNEFSRTFGNQNNEGGFGKTFLT